MIALLRVVGRRRAVGHLLRLKVATGQLMIVGATWTRGCCRAGRVTRSAAWNRIVIMLSCRAVGVYLQGNNLYKLVFELRFFRNHFPKKWIALTHTCISWDRKFKTFLSNQLKPQISFNKQRFFEIFVYIKFFIENVRLH